MNSVDIRNISFSYGGGKKVFDGLSFNLPNNCVLSLLGPNGSGKSTLLRIMAGLYAVEKGTYLFDGVDFSLLSSREKAEKVSFVPGEINTPFDFSSLQVVVMGRLRLKKWWQDYDLVDEKSALEVMKILAIENIASKNINKISSGERQLVFLSQAIAQSAKMLIMDEPSSHLDIKHKIKLFETVFQMKKNGLSCVYASHDIKASLAYSDYCLCLRYGHLFYFGPSAHVSQKMLADLYDVGDIYRLERFM